MAQEEEQTGAVGLSSSPTLAMPLCQKTTSSCYALKSGKELGDYIAEAGFAFGFGIGNAVRLCFKASRTDNPVEKQKFMEGCTFYIKYTATHTKQAEQEIAEIVSRIVGRIERDSR